jgi:Fe-S-cluster containining protein
VIEPDPLRELERQVERGNLFAHSVMTDTVRRANENEAIVNGLVDLLIQHKVVDSDELLAVVNNVRTQIAEAGEAASVGVAVRVDKPGQSGTPTVPVNCEERIPYCKAVCCRLRFALSVEEIEDGPLKWDLGRPYYNRQGPDGYCQQCHSETKACGVYEQRPTVCRQYSCAGDTRIWNDFEAMEINQEWIDENLGPDGPSPVEIYMTAYSY